MYVAVSSGHFHNRQSPLYSHETSRCALCVALKSRRFEQQHNYTVEKAETQPPPMTEVSLEVVHATSMLGTSHLSQRAEAETKDFVVQDGGGAGLHVHAHGLPHEKPMVVAETETATRRENGVSTEEKEASTCITVFFLGGGDGRRDKAGIICDWWYGGGGGGMMPLCHIFRYAYCMSLVCRAYATRVCFCVPHTQSESRLVLFGATYQKNSRAGPTAKPNF